MIGRTTIYTVVSLMAQLALSATSPAKAAALTGESLAEHWCSQCHAIKENQASPNPKAPTFPKVAAQPSISEYTLRVFLHTEHVTMPNFILKPEDADVLIDYIMSLKPTK
jgi:mono/diheme cytochrome c family protein